MHSSRFPRESFLSPNSQECQFTLMSDELRLASLPSEELCAAVGLKQQQAARQRQGEAPLVQANHSTWLTMPKTEALRASFKTPSSERCRRRGLVFLGAAGGISPWTQLTPLVRASPQPGQRSACVPAPMGCTYCSVIHPSLQGTGEVAHNMHHVPQLPLFPINFGFCQPASPTH